MFLKTQSVSSVAKTISSGLETGAVVLKTRRKWETKKTTLRFRIALLFSILSIISFELATPGYSVLFPFIQMSLDLDSSRKLFNYLSISPDALLVSNAIKYSFILIFAYFSFAVIAVNDPISNTSLARKIKSKGLFGKENGAQGIIGELRYYLKSTPPNQIAAICSICVHESNRKAIADINEYIERDWWKIFSSLDDDIVDLYLEKIHKCRSVILYKYSALALTILSASVYLFARLFEYMAGMTMNLNLELVIYAALLCSNYLFFSLLHPYKEESNSSVWFEHRTFVKNVIMKEKVMEQYVEHLCKIIPEMLTNCSSGQQKAPLVPR